jgi:tripartite-type tricarboxylate transporter receptor subunit TctC
MGSKSFLSSILPFALVFTVLVVGGPANAAEKPYPNRQIDIVVPYPPGGSLDLAVRAINEELGRNFGVPTVVLNKSGGSSAVGTEYAARAKPDGYTLLAGNNMMMVTVPATQSDLPYKASDFVPIARFGFTPYFFLVRKEAPWKTFEEFVAYAKKNPGKLTCATSGVASIGHFNLELLKRDVGIDVRHVPFKGGPPANTATLGGHVDLLSSSASAVVGLVKAGDLRALVVATEKRLPEFPDVPTLAEKGYSGSMLVLWNGLFALKGSEKPIIERISQTMEKTVKNPSMIKRIKDSGNEYEYIPGEKFAQEIEKEHENIVSLIKKGNLTFK